MKDEKCSYYLTSVAKGSCQILTSRAATAMTPDLNLFLQYVIRDLFQWGTIKTSEFWVWKQRKELKTIIMCEGNVHSAEQIIDYIKKGKYSNLFNYVSTYDYVHACMLVYICICIHVSHAFYWTLRNKSKTTTHRAIHYQENKDSYAILNMSFSNLISKSVKIN